MAEGVGYDLHSQLEADVRSAERRWAAGDWGGALDAYREIVRRRVVAHGYGHGDGASLAASLSAADLVVIERLAELCVPFGYLSAADDLLSVIAQTAAAAGNRFAADFAGVKRMHLALSRGDFDAAAALLGELGAALGDRGEPVTAADEPDGPPADPLGDPSADLPSWERAYAGGRWPAADTGQRRVFFSQFHFQAGRWFASHGRYGAALRLLARGLWHAGGDRPDGAGEVTEDTDDSDVPAGGGGGGGGSLARQAVVPLRLEMASALLEQGDLAAARRDLDALAATLDVTRRPGFAVRCWELQGASPC